MRKHRKTKKQKQIEEVLGLIFAIFIIVTSFFLQKQNQSPVEEVANTAPDRETIVALDTIPEYTDKPYVEINQNVPNFEETEYAVEPFERYSEQDALGRSGVAYANICKEIMPKEGEERGDISSVNHLSGWIQKRYDGIIKDKYLYNRCHLIGWQLAGENANKNNLITGTRYMNAEGMLPFENQVAEYLDNHPQNHVLYRVTPIYEGNNLLASGVEMEAASVEDNKQGICFHIYCYNVQPGIDIDYATGDSHIKE